MQLRHLGHATLLAATGQARVLFDPGTLSDQWHDLDDLDLVAVTHQHPDHLDVEHLPELLAANPGAEVVADADTARLLADHDVTARTVSADDTVTVGDLTLTVVGSTHAEIHPDVPRIPNVGYVAGEPDGARILHPGDALEAAPDVDVLALPLAAPWARAADVVDYAARVGAPHVVPIHDAVLSEVGRRLHLSLVTNLTDGITVADLSDGSRLTL